MSEPHSDKQDQLSSAVAAREERILRAKRTEMRSVWRGFGFFGLIGWSIVVPMLVGAALGRWLDQTYPGGRSWTLGLLISGLTLGCFNAGRWVLKEHQEIKSEQEDQQ